MALELLNGLGRKKHICWLSSLSEVHLEDCFYWFSYKYLSLHKLMQYDILNFKSPFFIFVEGGHLRGHLVRLLRVVVERVDSWVRIWALCLTSHMILTKFKIMWFHLFGLSCLNCKLGVITVPTSWVFEAKLCEST